MLDSIHPKIGQDVCELVRINKLAYQKVTLPKHSETHRIAVVAFAAPLPIVQPPTANTAPPTPPTPPRNVSVSNRKDKRTQLVFPRLGWPPR